MCVARGNSKIRPSYLQARAASRANHLAPRPDVSSFEARRQTAPPSTGSRRSECLLFCVCFLAESLAALRALPRPNVPSASHKARKSTHVFPHQHQDARTDTYTGVEECIICRRRPRRTTTSLGPTRRRRSPHRGSTHV